MEDSFKASFDQGPYGGRILQRPRLTKDPMEIGFIDLATENVNITLVL